MSLKLFTSNVLHTITIHAKPVLHLQKIHSNNFAWTKNAKAYVACTILTTMKKRGKKNPKNNPRYHPTSIRAPSLQEFRFIPTSRDQHPSITQRRKRRVATRARPSYCTALNDAMPQTAAPPGLSPLCCCTPRGIRGEGKCQR